MLVLARQLHERILIPLIDTAIEVVAARPGAVRLGIDAPPHVTVLREELARRGWPMQDSSSLSGSPSLQKRLHHVLLGLGRLQQEARALAQPSLAGSVDQVMKEVALISRQVSLLQATSDETVNSGLAI